MTGDAVARVGQQLLADFRMPVSRDLDFDRFIDQLLDPHPDLRKPRRFTEAARASAWAELAVLGPMVAPASSDAIKAWLWPVADAVERWPTEDEFFRRCGALFLASREIPHVAWTQKKQAEGMRQWDRFPSVQKVVDLITPPVRPLILRVRVLRRIISDE